MGSRRRVTLFVGSLAKHKIVAVAPDGKIRDFVPSGRDGLPLVLGMKVDRDRTPRSLWACTAEGDPAEGENTSRRSYLFRFDLETGKTLQKIPSPAGGRHLFNDLAIARSGDLYLTDSEEGTFYRLRPGTESLERLAAGGHSRLSQRDRAVRRRRVLYVAHAGGIAGLGRRETPRGPAVGAGRRGARPASTGCRSGAAR